MFPYYFINLELKIYAHEQGQHILSHREIGTVVARKFRSIANKYPL